MLTLIERRYKGLLPAGVSTSPTYKSNIATAAISRVMSLCLHNRAFAQRMIIYLGLPLPAASSDLPESRSGKSVALCLVLLRMGFTCALLVTLEAVVSYTAVPPLPNAACKQAALAVYFCCTSLRVASTGRYPASCPMEPGLSSPSAFAKAAIICHSGIISKPFYLSAHSLND